DDIRKTPGLTLTAMRTNGVFFLMFPEQWTAGSPWADRRVRLAASLAIDRRAINEAESLGFSGPTGNIVPRHQEFALAIPPDPYDPKRAKALLAEAGYASGFDAGEFVAALGRAVNVQEVRLPPGARAAPCSWTLLGALVRAHSSVQASSKSSRGS